MTIEEVYRKLMAWMGERAGQETAALGYFDGRWYTARQGGPAKDMWSVRRGDTELKLIFSKAIDSRNYVQTFRRKSEWSSYHAESIILSGMVSIGLGRDIREMSMEQIEAEFARRGGAYICANAPCCKHCGNLLTELKIKFYERSPNAGLTGWWNPVTDNVIANGDHAFKDDIPQAGRGYF